MYHLNYVETARTWRRVALTGREALETEALRRRPRRRVVGTWIDRNRC